MIRPGDYYAHKRATRVQTLGSKWVRNSTWQAEILHLWAHLRTDFPFTFAACYQAWEDVFRAIAFIDPWKGVTHSTTDLGFLLAPLNLASACNICRTTQPSLLNHRASGGMLILVASQDCIMFSLTTEFGCRW